MNKKTCLVLILIFILIITVNLTPNEKFKTDENGTFNYFYQSYLNPYSEHMIKFFSNDKIK